MDQKDNQRRRLVEWLTAEILRATGRRSDIKLKAPLAAARRAP